MAKKTDRVVFALLMMLAFSIDQIQEAACGLFQKAMAYLPTRRRFWEKFRGLFNLYFIKSWEGLFHAMGDDFQASVINFDTS